MHQIDLLLQLLVLLQINANSAARSFRKPLGQDFVEIGQLKVSLHPDVKQVAECKVRKAHQIANGLHDVPTVPFESAQRNDGELADADRKSRDTHSHRLSLGTDFKVGDLLLSLGPTGLLRTQS